MSGCAAVLLLPLAMVTTGLSVAFGGLAWFAAACIWLLWAQAVWASVRDCRRAKARRPAPRLLPRRELWTAAEVAALDGEADLRVAVDATPLKHKEAL